MRVLVSEMNNVEAIETMTLEQKFESLVLVDLLKHLLKSEMWNGELFNGELNGRLSVLKET